MQKQQRLQQFTPRYIVIIDIFSIYLHIFRETIKIHKHILIMIRLVKI